MLCQGLFLLFGQVATAVKFQRSDNGVARATLDEQDGIGRVLGFLLDDLERTAFANRANRNRHLEVLKWVKTE